MDYYKLEMMKIRFTTYFWTICAIFVSILGIGMLFLFMVSVPTKMGISTEEVGQFANWNGLLTLVTALSFALFGVLAGVLAGKIIITEYNGKGAVVLLSYPVNRKRIVKIKCLIVCGITTTSVFICNSILMGLMFATAKIFNLTLEILGGYFMVKVLITSALISLLSASVGMISTLIGWKMRSVTATTISSVIIVCLLTNFLVVSPSRIILIVFSVGVVFLVIANIMYHILANSINKMEV